MIKHRKQSEALHDPSRFKFILAGRRGGKTRLVIEDIVKTAYYMPAGGEIFYIGPTNAQAYEIIWDALQARLRELKWFHTPMVSKRRFNLSKSKKVFVFGAEKIDRIRGHKIFKAYLDEVAYYTTPLKEVWDAVRPALSDYKGKAIVTTTPNGKGTDAYDFFLKNKDSEGWKYFYWRTLDNPFIPPDEIETAKRELDHRSFVQEYEADWQSFEGLAYYSFNESIHVKTQDPLKVELPVDLTLDFNVNPTTLLVAQTYHNKMRVLREYSKKNSSTLETVKDFCRDFDQLKDKINLKIHGDAAGNNRSSNTGYSDYHYLKEVLTMNGFRFEMCVPASNPSIIDRVAHVNSWLKNVIGESRIEIDPSCKDLIRDLSSQEVDGRHPSPGNLNLGHKADSLGYYIYWKQVIGNRMKQGTRQL